MSIEIVEPVEGTEVAADGFVIQLAASGVRIVPAGTDEPGTGHHHILIDVEAPGPGQPIPSTEGYIHLGQAQTEHRVSELGPGWHRIIALLGDGQHMPHEPPVSDTVNVFVR